MQVAHRRANVVDLPVGPQPRRQSFYEKLAESLDAEGYLVKAMLVDASRFGVPQRRSRLIAIGIRKDLVERSEEHTSELQSLMRSSYAVFCLKKKHNNIANTTH